MMPALSVIIPLAPRETCWRRLLPLLALAREDEIIIAAHEPAPEDWESSTRETAAQIKNIRWQHEPAADGNGRARLMNAAADAAGNDFLWFVHADSRPAGNAVQRLRQSLAATPTALHYLGLRFYDGGWKMRLNEIGVFLRCRLFANPFGDQALCLSRALFAALGRYDETAAYGEDHLLVLKARNNGTAIVAVGSTVATSARRYIKHGWWNTVCLYQKLWWRQWRRH